MHTAPALLLASTLVLPGVAQIPDGYYVWGSQQGTAGQNGIFYSHPRDPLVPVGEITNLPPSLAYDVTGRRGCASVLYRRSDGALIAGERSPPGTSVDLHVLRLRGNEVAFAHLFSVGTSVAVGEIPQCALLPDGRIVVGASDLAAGGPLAQLQTQQYNWEGLGIVDTVSGSVTPIVVSNLAQTAGVLNGLAVTPDGATLYFCTWYSNFRGELWRVPVSGGVAVLLATLPGGPSCVVLDNDGTVLLPTLNGPPSPDPNLFRYDPVLNTLTPIPTTTGPLNCMAVEHVSGNYVVATRETGTPGRSLFWLTPLGQATLLCSPDRATINGIDVNPDPEVVAAGTPGLAAYDWNLAPNPGGLPLAGNAGFSLTWTASNATPSVALVLLGLRRLDPPLPVQGAAIHVDPATAALLVTGFQHTITVALPLPNGPWLRGVRLFGQAVHYEGGNTLAATPAVELTIL